MSTTDDESLSQIEKMVRCIVETFHPQRIILFGSHARENAGVDSDVDLLVVIPVNGSKRRLATQIDIALADRRLPLDLVVVTPDEFVACKDIVGHMLYTAVREGKVLYEHAA